MAIWKLTLKLIIICKACSSKVKGFKVSSFTFLGSVIPYQNSLIFFFIFKLCRHYSVYIELLTLIFPAIFCMDTCNILFKVRCDLWKDHRQIINLKDMNISIKITANLMILLSKLFKKGPTTILYNSNMKQRQFCCSLCKMRYLEL